MLYVSQRINDRTWPRNTPIFAMGSQLTERFPHAFQVDYSLVYLVDFMHSQVPRIATAMGLLEAEQASCFL